MKKEMGLLLAGAACFDLGNVAMAETIEPTFVPIYIASMSTSDFYLKLDMANVRASTNTCIAKSGRVVSYKGVNYCEIPKTASGKGK